MIETATRAGEYDRRVPELSADGGEVLERAADE